MSPRHSIPSRAALTGEWVRADALFSALLDLPAAERASQLARCREDDPALAETVGRLLDAEARSHALFDRAPASVAMLAAAALREPSGDDSSPATVSHVGPYKLVQCLGKGGTAVVWKGERDDGEFQQTVAVKVLRRWLDSDESVERFREERRILASLEHPNLARLLDGGVTDDGWPYFIMEYVDGTPITEYCDRRRLDVSQRLTLLEQVFQVVQYAHQRLVVHRDLKPSNILVTDAGQVKLLDFGIAKVLQSDAASTPGNELTEPGGRLLTPAYASPEQLLGERVSTATDVYALGVLLYRLLAGRSPYRVRDGQPALFQDAILHQVPPSLPERVLARDADDEDPRQLAAARASTPERLARTLRGDLDAICQVALRKEPEHRYASVEQLSVDIQRYRERLPVLARAGNRRYRAGRFLRRNALAVAASLVVPLVVLAALAAHVERLSTERDRAAAAALLAEREAAKAQQISGYLVDLFRAADPAESRGGDVTAIQLVDRGIERAGAIHGDTALQATMLHVLGQVSRSLGRYQQSDELLLQALTLLEREVDNSRLMQADVLAELGEANFQLGRLDVAEGYHRRALATLPEDELARRARTLTNLGIVHIVTSRYAEARDLLVEALTFHRRAAIDSAPHATTLNALGTLLSREARHSEAIDMLQHAYAMRRSLFGDTHPQTSVARGNLGIALLESGDPAAAADHLQQALAVDEQVLGPRHPSLAVLLNQLASARRELGDPQGAIAYLLRAVEILRENHEEHSPAIAAAVSGLGTAYLKLGEFDEAATYLAQAVAIDERVLGPQSRELAIDLVNLAAARNGQTRYDEAEALLLRSLGIFRTLLGERHELAGDTLRRLAAVYWHRGDIPRAIEFGAEGVAILAEVHGDGHADVVAMHRWTTALAAGERALPPPVTMLL